jgi:hypothetical protein
MNKQELEKRIKLLYDNVLMKTGMSQNNNTPEDSLRKICKLADRLAEDVSILVVRGINILPVYLSQLREIIKFACHRDTITEKRLIDILNETFA